jgi:flagellar biogenesis protein FliO
MVDGPSTVELLVRLVFSLGVVLGLLLLAAKVARRNGRALKIPGFGGFGGKREPTLKVIERQSITKSASLAVVQVGSRTMVVGVTEHNVSLLTDQLDEPEPEPAPEPDFEPARDTDHTVTSISAVREAKGMLPLDPGSAALDAAVNPARPPRMSFVDALREMTVRSA